MLRLFICFVALISSLAAHSESIDQLLQQANQNDPQAQFQVAMAYQSGTDKSLKEAFYWLRQAAENEHPQAIMQLAQNYLTGTGTEKDTTQAVYWLSKIAIEGNATAQYQLGELYQGLEQPLSSRDMAEMWFRLSANKVPEAEEAYSKILEERFNQRRAKQVSAIEQLNTIIDDQIDNPKNSELQESQQLDQDFILITIITLILLAVFSSYKTLQNKKRLFSQSEKHSQQQIIDHTVTIKKQKRQLETLYKELKRYQKQQSSSANNQKYQLACALFGYSPQQVPNEKEIKVRYKQLCKIYHPDMKGSDEEMKRLNIALKTLLENVMS